MLVIAGHDTDDGSLRARAVAAGVADDVRLLGGSPPRTLESLYALADCLVLPTLHEGFGLPVLEAMARSRPGRVLGPPRAARGGRIRSAVLRPACAREDRRDGSRS